jgi:HSP20 family protein
MNDKKKEEKKQEVGKARPRASLSPFRRFDLLPESGFVREMDRLFHDYLPRRWWQQFHLGWPERFGGHPLEPFEGKIPSVDILDRENDFLVKAELPGVEKKDIAISISNNVLTLEANVRREEKEEKGEYFRKEICSGVFRRSIELPVPVMEEDAKASFKNGILELTIPKREKTKRTAIPVD